MKQKKNLKRMNIEIPIELHWKLKAHAALRNMNMTDYVTKILQQQILKEEIYD